MNFDEIRNHYHLTEAYRGPAHQECKINIKQKQRIFFQTVFHNFSKYDCHLHF